MFVCIDGFSSSRETPNYHMTGATFVCPTYAQSFAHTVSVSDTSCKKQLFVPLQPYTHATHTHTHTDREREINTSMVCAVELQRLRSSEVTGNQAMV